jgi:thiol-disulfide isomerase/thioredoxin
VASLALAALPALAQGPTSKVPPVEFGEPFPVATYNIFNPAPGGPSSIDLADLVGQKPLILYYWIAGHERAERVFLQLQDLVGRSVGKLALLGVATERPGREASAIRARIGELGIQVPVVNDEGFKIGQMLAVQSVPNVTILDAEGRLRLSNGASLQQVVEYKLDLEGVIRRLAATGQVGTHGQLPVHYPVKDLVGQKCPDFKAPELGNGVVRRWHSLLDPNRVNVLVFWSVDCPHCRKTLPELNEWLKHNGEGINVVSAAAVADDAQRAKTEEYCRLNNFVFRTLLDQNRVVGEQFQVTATPTMLIIAPDGTIDSVVVTGDFVKAFQDSRKHLLPANAS